MRFLSPRGWAAFAWQADYGQFYLIDGDGSNFEAPADITPEMMERSFFAPAAGLIVYTLGCLQQHIRIAIYEAEPDHAPAEPIWGKPWTRIQTTAAHFPSRKFTISSPSAPTPLPAGPIFLLDSADVMARIAWMEFQDARDDSVPVEPDVIEVTIWPR